jgi:hypothetical protein
VVAGMVAGGAGAGGCSVKNIEEKAFRPLVAKRERVRPAAAAMLNSGVMARGAAATCGGRKRLGSGCKKREQLKASVWAGPVHQAFACVLPSVVPPPSVEKCSGRLPVPACISPARRCDG